MSIDSDHILNIQVNLDQKLKQNAIENTYNTIFGKEDIFERRKRTDHHSIVICGHRGGYKTNKEPENTLRAFSHGIEMGLQVIECDVSLSIFKFDTFNLDLVNY